MHQVLGLRPGGHIFDVVGQILKKHVFTAIFAQHVASELRMRLWCYYNYRSIIYDKHLH